MSFEVENYTGFLKVLTWKKIAQLIVVILIIGVTYGCWENRTTVYNSLKVGSKVEIEETILLKLSQPTVQMLEENAILLKNNVVGIQVLNVNWRRNTRSVAHFSIVDSNLKSAYNNFVAGKISETVLFSDNELNNQQIINVINGEFVCSEFKDTIDAKTMPSAASTISTVCSISIPPYYGRFSGYMSIFLIKKPTADELSAIRQVAREISMRIYDSDVKTDRR